MKISFDRKADAMRIKFQEGKYALSKEIDEGIILDMTADNQLMAIEILDVSERISKENLRDIAVGVSS